MEINMPQGIPLKDFRGRIYGYLDTHSNGDVWAYDFKGRLVGKYLKSENITRDWVGHNISTENVVASLIPPIEQQ